jgi:hypothetical protein
MGKRRLNKDEEELLREIVSKYLANDAERLLEQSPEEWLSTLRRRVRDAVGEELAATGFDMNYEPTSRGQMLESLIDFLNRIELGPKSN